jgi:hypothetical protein
MKSKQSSAANSHSRQRDLSRDGGSFLLAVKTALSSTGLTAEQITAALLLVICVAAAVFV